MKDKFAEETIAFQSLEPPETYELALLRHIRDAQVLRTSFILDMYDKDLEDPSPIKKEKAQKTLKFFQDIFSRHCLKMVKDDIFWLSRRKKKEGNFDA